MRDSAVVMDAEPLVSLVKGYPCSLQYFNKSFGAAPIVPAIFNPSMQSCFTPRAFPCSGGGNSLSGRVGCITGTCSAWAPLRPEMSLSTRSNASKSLRNSCFNLVISSGVIVAMAILAHKHTKMATDVQQKNQGLGGLVWY